MEKPNAQRKRPVVSFKTDKALLENFDELCRDADVDRSLALTNIITYLTRPENTNVSKMIMKYS